MRYALSVRRALVVLFVLVPIACGDSSTTGYGSKGIGANDDPRPQRDSGVLEETDGGTIGSSGGESSVPTSTDADGDGTPDAMDCDPASPALRRRVVEDALASDKGLFAAAAGFPAASWSYDTAYRQTRLSNESDASLYVNDADLGDVQIEVRTASTEVGAITPRLRQIFVVVGATSNGGSLLAHGCGIEVVEGMMPEQKTSIVKLEGPSTNVVTTALQRVTRPAVQANEKLSIKLRLEDGAMTCDVTQGSGATAVTTTATASGLAGVRGRAGFFTRQTKALFESVRICNLK